MARLTYREVLMAVAATLGLDARLVRSETLETLTEGVNDTPMVKVFLESAEVDVNSQRAERTTFGGGIRQHQIGVKVHMLVRQRSQLGEDLAACIDRLDAFTDILESQTRKPYFGREGIKGFHWVAQAVTLIYGDPALSYTGYEISITIQLF